MRTTLIALLSGFIFGLGLILSGMTNPEKVLNFLNPMHWDPSLMFVMGGAILINIFTFTWGKRRGKTLDGINSITWPEKQSIDRSLMIGSVLFGIGWGLVGICPGPAIVNFISLKIEFVIFVFSMLLGMWLFNRAQHLYRIKNQIG